MPGPRRSGDSAAIVRSGYAPCDDADMNRLADCQSPYLLQHADNPVDWWPWAPDAFEEARRRRNVLVLLSVGYSACHW